MQRALTDTLVRSIAPPATGRLEIGDLKSTGLALRITANGSRSWCFRFRDPKSRRTTRATIGPYPTVPLAKARKEADTLRRQVAGGDNPITRKRSERDTALTRTFGALAERYLAEHARRHKRSADADDRNLRLHILPKWRKRRYDEIERRDIIELIEGLVKDGKPTLANRVQALVSGIYSFAMDAALVKGNPGAQLRRRGAETVGSRVLSDDELRLFWTGIVQKPVSRRVGLALRLILLTGVRPGEAAGIARAEIENLGDKGRARWIIPVERSKNGRAHLVPLSEPARQTIVSALELIGDDDAYLFPSPAKPAAPITAHAFAVAMARFAKSLETGVAKDHREAAKMWRTEPPSPHDLRRTVATRLSELGVVKEDRDVILNHVRGDVGSKHYDKYEREREKRRALDLWAETLGGILEGRSPTAVVSFAKARVRKARR